MNLAVTPELLALFRAIRLGTKARGGERWKLDDILTVTQHTKIEPYSHIFVGETLPLGLGAFSYSFSEFDPWMSVGRYCSIATGVALMGSHHPLDWASSSPFSYEPHQLDSIREYMNDRGAEPLVLHDPPKQALTALIGHDVWIGGGVMIKRGVRIGTGAVLAARALVTRDVPPYAVVAGTPARIMRYRFPEPLIERLLKSQWWRYGPDVLQPLDVRDPERFVDRVAELDGSAHKPLGLRPLTGEQMIAAGRVVE